MDAAQEAIEKVWAECHVERSGQDMTNECRLAAEIIRLRAARDRVLAWAAERGEGCSCPGVVCRLLGPCRTSILAAHARMTGGARLRDTMKAAALAVQDHGAIHPHVVSAWIRDLERLLELRSS